MADRKLIGPAWAHQDAPCTDACYEPLQRPLIQVPADGVKMLRETLCVAQTLIGLSRQEERKAEHIGRLQALIDELDVHRPLGPDGKQTVTRQRADARTSDGDTRGGPVGHETSECTFRRVIR